MHFSLTFVHLVFILALFAFAESEAARSRTYIVTRLDEPLGSPFNPCEMPEGNVNAVRVSGCSNTDERCLLYGGTNVTFELDLTSKVDSPTLKAVVHGIVGGIPVPFHVPNSDACKNCGIECPLKQGSNYQYSTTLPVLKSYPKLSVEVKWELQSDSGTVACVIIPAAIR